MAKPTQLPDFCTDTAVVDLQSGQNNVVEPDAGNKPEGWKFQQLPPRGWMNWLHNLYYEWIKYFDEVITGSVQSGTVTVRAYSGTVDSGADVTLSWYANRIDTYPTDVWTISVYVENSFSLALDVGQAGADGTYTIKPTSGNFPFQALTDTARIEIPINLTTDQPASKNYLGYLELAPLGQALSLYWYDAGTLNFLNTGLLQGTNPGDQTSTNINFNFLGKPV